MNLQENKRVYDYVEGRNTVPMEDRYSFDIDKLVDVGAVFITPAIDWDPDSPTYKEWLDEPYSHLLSLYNVLKSSEDSWVKKAITKKASTEHFKYNLIEKLYDGKYNQILWSLEKLGIDPNDMLIEDKSLQEHIRKVLREETRFNKMGDERYKSCSMSDITRMEIIDDFIKKTKINPEYNVEEPDYDMLLDDWDGYDDQVYIKNELDKGRIIFYEGWVDSCWNAVNTKPEYEGMNEEEVIESIITKRFPRIAEEFDMVIDDYRYFNNGDGYIMYVIFKSTLMNLQEHIRKVLREETQKLPAFILRRVTEKKIDKLIKNVRTKIRLGFSENDAIYDEVRNFIAWEFLGILNRNFPREQDYWDFYMEIEKPLVDFVKSKLN